MFSVWDIHGQPAHHDWRRVNRALGPAEPHAYDEDLTDPGQTAVRRGVRRQQAARAWQEALDDEKKRTQRRPARTAEQIMTAPVLTIREDTTVMQAWQRLKSAGVRHLPVLNAGGRLVGILSERDLLRVAGTPDSHPLRPVQNKPVSEVMRTRVFSAQPDAPIREIAKVLVDQKIGAMPIIDDELDLVGVVTRGDILRTLLHAAPTDLWI